MRSKLRLVLDTAVLIAAVRSPTGASSAMVKSGLAGEFEWLLSNTLLTEYEAVLLRSEHLLAANSSKTEIETFLAAVLSRAARIDVERSASMYLRDEGDEHVLSLALGGRADAVVTHNLRDFASLPERFGVNLYTPGQALFAIRSTP